MYRNQAEEEDTEEDYKPKGGKGSWHRGNNYWDRSSSSRDTGKGSHSQWDDYRRPASSRIDYAGPKDRPDKWWKARDFEEYDPRFDDLVQDSTRRRREDDRQQEGRHTRQRGRGLDDPTLFFPCEECMAVAGTLIVGYERSIIEYLEDTTAKLQQAICDLTYEDLHEKQGS